LSWSKGRCKGGKNRTEGEESDEKTKRLLGATWLGKKVEKADGGFLRREDAEGEAGSRKKEGNCDRGKREAFYLQNWGGTN